MTEAQLANKMEVDNYNKLVAEAAAAAQEALDAAQAVELTSDKKVELLEEMGLATALPTDLDRSNIENVASAQLDALERGLAYRKVFYREMKNLDRVREEIYDTDGETSEAYIKANTDYYHKKAEVDLLTTIIKTIRKDAKEAQQAVDEARLGGGISDYDKREIDKKLAAANALVNAVGESDAQAIYSALKNLEEEYAFDYEKL